MDELLLAGNETGTMFPIILHFRQQLAVSAGTVAEWGTLLSKLC